MSVVVVAGLVVAVATVVQRLTGMGFGIVAVPLLALVAPDVGILAILLVTVLVMAAVTWIERDALDRPALLVASAASLPGIAVGTWLAAHLPLRATHLAIGAIVVAGSIIALAGWRAPAGRASLVAGALAAGVLTPVAALPGPPIALAYRPDDVRRMRTTLSAFFAFGAVVSVGALLVAGATDAPGELLRAAALAPAVAVGLVVAIPLVRRMPAPTVRVATLVLSLASGAALFLRAAWAT
ncbi:sulfite exporter TauE/SafE family protein [Agromyces sp. SYSU T00194]|uniref:sulfite exporter TauE/SafE family protein n=1 Tax=Agromyces chitinivorans TaxID=3158560 RepID=UPI00339611D0